jgi:hypothetical protein
MKSKQKPKNYYKINAIFYTLVAIALVVIGFFLNYPENVVTFFFAFVVGACAIYWIRHAIK